MDLYQTFERLRKGEAGAIGWVLVGIIIGVVLVIWLIVRIIGAIF